MRWALGGEGVTANQCLPSSAYFTRFSMTRVLAHGGVKRKGGHGSFYKALLVHPGAPPARAKILSHARSSAERHPCAASVAHSPPPSSRVEAVGQLRGRDAARLQCQPPRDVVALLHLAPSPLPLRVRRPAPSNGSRLRSHATPQCCGAGPSRTDTRNAPWMLPRLYISLGWGSPALMCTGRSTTRN